MERYGNISGKSGVTAYQSHRDSGVVRFKDGWTYEYTAQSAGAAVVAKMKRLAAAGRGLSTFISQEVGMRYARKFR